MAVRPGGTLVYSVATATVIETLDVITAFLGSHAEFRLDPFPHPLEESTTTGTLQLWPHLHDSEARFIARMVRKASPNHYVVPPHTVCGEPGECVDFL